MVVHKMVTYKVILKKIIWGIVLIRFQIVVGKHCCDCRNNITTLIIGKKFAQKQLGFYNRAEQIGYFPATNLTAILQRVTFPVFSQMQDSPITLRNSYLKTIQVTSLLTFFIMGSLFILAEPLIIALLTSKWSSSIKFCRYWLPVLCGGLFLH